MNAVRRMTHTTSLREIYCYLVKVACQSDINWKLRCLRNWGSENHFAKKRNRRVASFVRCVRYASSVLREKLPAPFPHRLSTPLLTVGRPDAAGRASRGGLGCVSSERMAWHGIPQKSHPSPHLPQVLFPHSGRVDQHCRWFYLWLQIF